MFLKRFVSITDAISEWLGRILSFLIPGMMIVLTVEVVSRYVFVRPTSWANETSTFMWGYTFMLGGAYVLRHDAHIRMDAVYSRWSPRARALADVLTGLLFFFFISLLVYVTWDFALKSIISNEHSVSAWGPPLAHFRLLAPAGGFLLLMEGLAKWLKNLYFVITQKDLMA